MHTKKPSIQCQVQKDPGRPWGQVNICILTIHRAGFLKISSRCLKPLPLQLVGLDKMSKLPMRPPVLTGTVWWLEK